MSANTPANLPALKDAMRSMWMAGDFGIVAKTISSSANAFVTRLPLTPGMRVLDIATGTGNVAIPLARHGCVVTGVDIAPNLLVQARARAAAEGLSITFDEGDAEQLPYPDASFDAVTTMFGAMFAPRPELVAQELARVLKPGGLLAMANWNPASFSGQMFAVGSKHVPPPPGVPPPVLWGDDRTVRARLTAGVSPAHEIVNSPATSTAGFTPNFTAIRTELIPVDFDLPTNPAGAVAFFRQYFGPTQVAFARLDSEGQGRFAADLESLWAGANIAPDPTVQTLIRNEYLQVIATRT